MFFFNLFIGVKELGHFPLLQKKALLANVRKKILFRGWNILSRDKKKFFWQCFFLPKWYSQSQVESWFRLYFESTKINMKKLQSQVKVDSKSLLWLDFDMTLRFFHGLGTRLIWSDLLFVKIYTILYFILYLKY